MTDFTRTRTLSNAIIDRKIKEHRPHPSPFDTRFSIVVSAIFARLSNDTQTDIAITYTRRNFHIDSQNVTSSHDTTHALVLSKYNNGFVSACLDGRAITVPLDKKEPSFYDELMVFPRDVIKIRNQFTMSLPEQGLLHDWLASQNTLDWNKLHPHILKAFANNDNLALTTQQLFGSKKKDLVKSVARAVPSILNIAYTLYDESMPIDYVVRFLNATQSIIEVPIVTNVELLRSFSLKSRQKMLNNFNTQRDETSMFDIIAMIAMDPCVVEPTREVKHFKEAEAHLASLTDARYRAQLIESFDAEQHKAEIKNHWLTTPVGQAWQEELNRQEQERLERGQRERERLEAERKAKLLMKNKVKEETYQRLLVELDNYEHIDENGTRFTITVAQEEETLKQWSKTLDNCINSAPYTKAIETHDKMLLALMKQQSSDSDQELIYNIEISMPHTSDVENSTPDQKMPKVVQFRGYQNNVPEESEILWVEELFQSLSIQIIRK